MTSHEFMSDSKPIPEIPFTIHDVMSCHEPGIRSPYHGCYTHPMTIYLFLCLYGVDIFMNFHQWTIKLTTDLEDIPLLAPYYVAILLWTCYTTEKCVIKTMPNVPWMWCLTCAHAMYVQLDFNWKHNVNYSIKAYKSILASHPIHVINIV